MIKMNHHLNFYVSLILNVFLLTQNIEDAFSSGIAKTIKLRDGHSMPLLGYGSWSIDNKTLIKDIIMAGYRLIDTAYHYQNEKELGAAIKELIDEGKIKRQDLFITTKVWNTFHSRSKVLEGAKLSKRNLGLDYIDLLLIHWPIGLAEGQGMLPKDKNGNIIFSQVDYVETWAGMEDVYEAGIAKSIGVSNFNHKQIERVLAMAKIKPVINQVECHPYLQQAKLQEFCRNHSIALEGYSPLAEGGSILKDPVMKSIAESHKKSPAQIALRYAVERDIVVIPRSSNKVRIAENINIFDFKLTQEEMEKIAKLERNGRVNFGESDGVKGARLHKYYPFNEPY